MWKSTAIQCLIGTFSLILAGSADANPTPKPDVSVATQTAQAAPAMAATGETRHISIVMVGDTGYAPHGFAPKPNGVAKHGRWLSWEQTTRHIAPHINGDINFANMESVISANVRLRRVPKAFNFVTHPNGARHLVNVGFNLFSMANNHSFDFGAQGIRDSVRHANELTRHGLLAHAGIGHDRWQAAHAPTFEVEGTKFAFGAIGIGASYGGPPRASTKRPGQLGINHNEDVSLLMHNLKTAKADYRILSVHRGPERYIRTGAGEIKAIRSTMLKQGDVDLVIGHHAHVTRGVEINDGRLILYGLGNFLHQGTANMAGKGGCRDYSIIARAHLVADGHERPKLAALEIVPITATHVQTRVMKPRAAAKRMAILNGLAAQFDDDRHGAEGVRFSIRGDGTGLYCTAAAWDHAVTKSICLDYMPVQPSQLSTYRKALKSCGRSYQPLVAASRSEPAIRKSRRKAKAMVVAAAPARPTQTPKKRAKLAKPSVEPAAAKAEIPVASGKKKSTIMGFCGLISAA
ncbi:MAG: CapA family protein [Ahrensia sp.]|nr:CapA family protein [Ahrensia sp.]